MGILDEAIREHLELKREHGASEDEIRRKEAEAFGPARAEVAPAAAEEPVSEDEHTQLLQPGDHPVPDAHDHLHPAGSDPAWGEDTEFFSEQPATEAAPEPRRQHHEDEQHPALVDHEHLGGEEHAPEPVFRPSAETPAGAPEAPTGPTTPPEEPNEGEGEEDVLEETPEFLQDAPEHDRLWFEQKPPRDFDFGE
ncbi:MAG TPA: hypothetical protein VH300_13165 [Thermoleophilaceae bacterium]|jgi:hypothetical protein|nr:hypothetical protein [Thermoleophilaceae bacterium]